MSGDGLSVITLKYSIYIAAGRGGFSRVLLVKGISCCKYRVIAALMKKGWKAVIPASELMIPDSNVCAREFDTSSVTVDRNGQEKLFV